LTVEDLINALSRELKFDSRYNSEDEEWVLDLELPAKRKQELTVRTLEEDGVQFVRFFTGVGRTEQFSQQKIITAMELNSSLLYGAIAIYEGSIVITEAVPLDRELKEIVQVVGYITRMADAYEKMLFGVDRV
jgi:hypothetical protein